MEEADLVLWLIDASQPLTEEDDAVFGKIASKRCVMLLNKVDLPQKVSVGQVQERFGGSAPTLSLSVLNPHDVEKLRDFLTETCLRNPLAMGHSMIIPNLRHRSCLGQALAALCRTRDLLQKGIYGELASIELGIARHQLESILGWVQDDEVLDRIFSQFCLGK